MWYKNVVLNATAYAHEELSADQNMEDNEDTSEGEEDEEKPLLPLKKDGSVSAFLFSCHTLNNCL